MNAPDLLRAGGWRQGHHEDGSPYWEHVERYGLARWSVDSALGDELARVSADRLREAHGFARREEALQRQVADLQRVEDLAKREPNYQTALEAWSAEIGNRQKAEADRDAERADHAKTTEGLRICGEAFVKQQALTADLQAQIRSHDALLGEAQEALGETGHALKASKLLLDLQKAEPHWLVKDFNVLYRAALRLFDEAEGAFGGSAERTRRALGAQLERLKPAFAETEAARAELAGRGGQ